MYAFPPDSKICPLQPEHLQLVRPFMSAMLQSQAIVDLHFRLEHSRI